MADAVLPARTAFNLPAALKEAGLTAFVVCALAFPLVGFQIKDVPGGIDLVTRFMDVLAAGLYGFLGRMALIAGVQESDVLVDRESRRAEVRAKPLPGADLMTYATLEKRITASVPKWQVRLLPPARPLPSVQVVKANKEGDGDDGGEDGLVLTEDGQEAVDLIVWAAQRIPAPVQLNGGAQDVAVVQEALAARQVPVVTRTARRNTGTVQVSWTTPDTQTGEE